MWSGLSVSNGRDFSTGHFVRNAHKRGAGLGSWDKKKEGWKCKDKDLAASGVTVRVNMTWGAGSRVAVKEILEEVPPQMKGSQLPWMRVLGIPGGVAGAENCLEQL